MLVLALGMGGCAHVPFDAQGHRGARGLLPENTIVAFDRALELCADTLEFDIGVSEDGVPVVYHDRTLNPDMTRDARGVFFTQRGPALHALPVSELLQLDVGGIAPQSAYAKLFPKQVAAPGARMPTLVQMFERYRGRKSCRGAPVQFNIETKISPLAPDETPTPMAFVQAIVKEVERFQVQDRVSIQSFDWRTLAIVRDTAPSLTRVYLTNEQGANETVQRGKPGASPWLGGLDVDDFQGSLPAAIASLGGKVWSPNFRDLTHALVRDAQHRGVRVIPWTVNERDDIQRLLSWGVDGIISDYPDVLERVRREFNR